MTMRTKQMAETATTNKVNRVRLAITYSLATVLGTLLIFGNIVGQHVVRPNLSTIGQYGPHFDVEERFEHGFPFTYVSRGRSLTLGGDRSPGFFDIVHNVEQFDALNLIVNVVIGVAALVTSVLVCNAWLQRKKRLAQLSTLEMLLCVGSVACIAAVYSHARSDYLRELGVLQALTARSGSASEFRQDVTWSRGGPTWLRRLIGDVPFRVFDRVVALEATGEQLEYVIALKQVRAVRVTGTVSNLQLKSLEQLPNLETLDLSFVALVEEFETIDADGVVLEPYLCLPTMLTLRGINLYDTAFKGDGLEAIPSIEVLDLTATDIGDESVGALATLAELKQLLLGNTKFSDAGINRLRELHRSCDIIR